MKNKKILEKRLLYLSFVPYILLIINSIYVCFTDSFYDISDFFICFGNLFINTIFSYWVILLVLVVLYQVWYFVFRFKFKAEKTVGKSNKSIRKKINVKKILLYISILCWIIYFGIGIYYYFNGYCAGLFFCENVYGLEALKLSLVWYGLVFSIYPVLPITLIYIVFYTIKYRSKK